MTAFTRDIIVRFEHCDAAGIMFYPRFLALVNEMVEDWFAGPLDHSFKIMHLDHHKAVPTVSLNAEFVRPARLGDQLTQSLRIAHLGGASCRLHHEAHIGGALIARFDHVIVHVDLGGMKPEPWPAQVREAMARFEETRA